MLGRDGSGAWLSSEKLLNGNPLRGKRHSKKILRIHPAAIFTFWPILTFPYRDWWIASTAIPLVAATTAPMANLMSVVALVTPWRSRVYPDQLDSQGRVLQIGYSDPHW